jgi:hypothetical protein
MYASEVRKYGAQSSASKSSLLQEQNHLIYHGWSFEALSQKPVVGSFYEALPCCIDDE